MEMRVSQQIIEVLEFLGEKFGIAIDWSSDTLLPVIKELCAKYISWEIMTSIIWIIICVLVVIGGIILLTKSAKMCKEPYADDFAWSFGVVGGILMIVIGVIVIAAQTFDIARCYCFPELQVYKYIESLIRTSTAQ